MPAKQSTVVGIMVGAALSALTSARPASAQLDSTARDRIHCRLSANVFDMPVDSSPRRLTHPDLVVYTVLSARTLRFASKPDMHVRLCGAMDSVRVVDRRNLPIPLQQGVTYRNAYLAIEILGRVEKSDLVAALRQADTSKQDGRPSYAPITGNRDVVVDAPRLSADSVGVGGHSLSARLAVDANSLGFVDTHAGLYVLAPAIRAGLTGVSGEVYFAADLDNVTRVVAKVLQAASHDAPLLQLLRSDSGAVTGRLRPTTAPPPK